MTNHPNRSQRIAPPPAGSSAEDDRDEACCDALEPHLLILRDRAVAAGWTDAEIVTAILALTISEMRARAGDAPTRNTLAQAIMMLDD